MMATRQALTYFKFRFLKGPRYVKFFGAVRAGVGESIGVLGLHF